jgi:hypothetical protein
MEPLILAASLACSGLAALTSGMLVARRARPLRERIDELEGELNRERNTSRRRLEETRKEGRAALDRTRAAVGLPPGPVVTMQGARLAVALKQRMLGVEGVSHVTLVDETGLAWTREEDAAEAALAAVGGEALRLARALGFEARELHLETNDARHLVVRPLHFLSPPLALVTLSLSRPAAASLLDATVAYAMLAAQAEGLEAESAAADALAGMSEAKSGSGAVAESLLAELSALRASCAARSLTVTLGEELLACQSAGGPSLETMLRVTTSLRALASYAERRLGVALRRLDLASAAGGVATFAPLGTSGRFQLLAVADAPGIDALTIDRLIGRLRRLLPPAPPVERDVRRVA